MQVIIPSFFFFSFIVFIPLKAFTKEVSFTFDDFDISETLLLTAEQKNQKLLDVLDKHAHLKVTLFVQGKNVDSKEGQKYLK